jgi:hypothetical protein
MDSYEIIARLFPGFTLADIKNLSFRERDNWILRSTRFKELNNG